MRKFEYTITDPLGIHARPAGLLVKKAAGVPCAVTIALNGKIADAKKIFAVMGLSVKCGDHVEFTVEGEGEDSAIKEIEEFVTNNL